MTRRQKKESRVCFVLGEAMSRRSNLFTDTCVLKHRQMMTSDLSRVLCSTPSGILFSLLVFFSLFLWKDERKESLKSSRPKEILNIFFPSLVFSSSLSAKCITYWWYNLKDTSYTSSRDCFWLSTAGKCNSARGGMKDAGAEAAMMPVYII